jgi:hypothetical protein
MQNNKELRSILDVNSKNVWKITETELAFLWQKGITSEDLKGNEDKMVNVIRHAFDVDHFASDDEREETRYRKMGYITMQTGNPKRNIAIRKKQIRKITDLSYENIHHINAKTLLELIESNFGGGWDSISLSIRDIIETAFFISTTTLPAARLHMKGGMMDKKLEDGYEMLEISKGLWVEAIFAKKKELVMDKPRFQNLEAEEEKKRRRGEDDDDLDDDDEDLDDEDEKDDRDKDDDEDEDDETYYGSFTPEAAPKGDMTLDDLSEDL